MMLRVYLVTIVLVVVGGNDLASALEPDGQRPDDRQYVCPPCGLKCDEQVFDGPGTCPGCGMGLLQKSQLQHPRNVAIVIWDGVELLDFSGPGEVFAAARAFNVYTVAYAKQSIVSQGFVHISPQYSITNCPKPDILVLPGGGTRNVIENPEMIAWIKRVSEDAEIVLSVCTGAFLLAKAGLLDGLEATTHWGSISGLRQAAPKTKVHADRRFVDNGKIITSAGVSAGIDSSLHVVARLLGPEAAQGTARYMEYNWQPEGLPAHRAPNQGSGEREGSDRKDRGD